MADSPSYQFTFTNQQPDEQEVAACMAALLTYLEVQGQEANGEVKEPRTQLSNWGQAALLEGTQVVPRISAPDQIAKTGLKRSILAIALVLISNICSFGTAWATGGVDSEDGAEPGSVADAQPDPFGAEPEMPSAFASDSRSSNFQNHLPQSQNFPQTQSSFPAEFGLPQASQRQGVTIRVGLAVDVPSVEIAAIDGAEVVDASTGKVLAAVRPHSRWQLALTRGGNGYAMTVCAKRPLDRNLIATGESLAQIKNVAFTPAAALMPPVVPSAGAAMAAAKTVAAKTANPPVLTVPLTWFNDKYVKTKPATAPTISFMNRAIVGAGNGSVTSSSDEFGVSGAAANGSVSGASIPSNCTACGVMIIPDSDFRGGTSNLLSVNGKLYRGAVLVKPSMVGASARLSAINVLDLEDYLMSVLPSEMPSSWPLEAQKAQAIAARSYAVANLGKNGSKGFDVVPTIADQVYTGIARETDSSTRAVRETAGIILKHGGRPVSAFFHSTSAGYTEVAEHVWVKGVPFLRSVPDFDVKSKYNNWQRKFDMAAIEKVYGPAVGQVLGMFVVSRSPSQRVKSFMVVGQNGTTVTSGKDLRVAFKLPSTNFNVLAEDGAYVFKGQGFGHGLGMSQYGAKALAEHTYNAAQILKYYYKDVTFDYVVETKTL